MRYFPLFADLDNADVLVVGGGEQATQKVRLLLKTGARLRVVAATVADELRELDERRALAIVPRPFEARDVEGMRLVYAATGDRALDARIAGAAKAGNVPVNVVDAPELSTFIMPAIVDRAPVTVAIGTEGAAPCWRGRSRAGSSLCCRQTSGRSPAGRRVCASSSPAPLPTRAHAAACGSGCSWGHSAAPC
jgi:uroporphyrin-III C-methyltransferase/precorrin-2 dehydrogenase/sirohydrochlorin ferrochelatase